MLLKQQRKNLARESGRLPLLLQIQSFTLIPCSIEDCLWQLSLSLLPPFLVDHTDLSLQTSFCTLIALAQSLFQQTFPENAQATPVRETDTLTLYISLSSKSCRSAQSLLRIYSRPSAAASSLLPPLQQITHIIFLQTQG